MLNRFANTFERTSLVIKAAWLALFGRVLKPIVSKDDDGYGTKVGAPAGSPQPQNNANLQKPKSNE